MLRKVIQISALLLGVALLLGGLYLAFFLYLAGQIAWAVGLTVIVFLGAYVYTSKRAYTWRYLFPGLLGFSVFIILPLLYTVGISLTEYNSRHQLTFDRVAGDFLRETYLGEGDTYRYTLYREDLQTYRVLLESDEARLLSEPFDPLPEDISDPSQADAPAYDKPIPLAAVPAEETPPGEALRIPDITRGGLLAPLKQLQFQLPDAGPLLSLVDLRSFAVREQRWLPAEDGPPGTLINQQTSERVAPDRERGYFVNLETDESVGPGFRNWVGWENYVSIFTDERINGPFFKIFVWTLIFAGVSVLCTFAVGVLLAIVLNWEELALRKTYRTLLILPYAVPAFLSILIFQGLFNQEFGGINALLEGVFNLKPEWNTDPFMAKIMIILVNVWLGYPYMMIVCTGVLQSIPRQIYEASAIDGSNPWNDFRRLTLPLLLPPILPLMVASFAFNFNNFNLIYLLTAGGPKMVGGTGIAGETDILVTYTFNLAFRDSGANYGLASAVATLLFIIVAVLAWVNLRVSNRKMEANS